MGCQSLFFNMDYFQWTLPVTLKIPVWARWKHLHLVSSAAEVYVFPDGPHPLIF